MSLSRFLAICESEMLEKWSKNRSPNTPNQIMYATNKTIESSLWTSGYELSLTNRESKLVKSGDQNMIFMLSSKNNASKKINIVEEIKLYREHNDQYNWKDFEEYKDFQFRLHVIKFNNTEWQKSECNCSYFQKNYICKHVIFIAVRYGLCVIPNNCKNVVLGVAQKRGRKTKA